MVTIILPNIQHRMSIHKLSTIGEPFLDFHSSASCNPSNVVTCPWFKLQWFILFGRVYIGSYRLNHPAAALHLFQVCCSHAASYT